MTGVAIGVDGTIGASRVGFREYGHRSPEFEAAVLDLRGQVPPVSCREIAARMGVHVSVIHRVCKRHGLTGEVRAARTLNTVHRVDTALEYVDDLRIMRGPDTEGGECTYIASVNDDSVVGHTCQGVDAAINDVIREWRRQCEER